MKKVLKKFKPAFTVDITNCADSMAVLSKFAAVKLRNGICPTAEEWICLMIIEMCLTFNTLLGNNDAIVITKDGELVPAILCPVETTVVEAKPKKQNVFKRFWNWITRKK